MARVGAVQGDLLVGLLRSAACARRGAHQGRQGVRVPPDGRPDFRVPRRENGLAVAQPPRGREPAALRGHAPRPGGGGRRHSAHEARPAQRQLQHVRPDCLSHQVQAAPARGQRVVHLPVVRLHALPRGRARGHHALHVHSRVRDAPGELLLALPSLQDLPAPRVGVLAPQHHQHGHVQAQAQPAGHGPPRRRLGRSAPAYAVGPASPRRHARRHQRVLPRRGRLAQRQRDPACAPRALHSRGPQPQRSSRNGRAGPASRGHHKLGRQ
mmetsp:Transcript_854/g.3334  ORF Transcript_854/g.3334 Transcript_854/m.3334 type:complete len:268 (-) Transcript_854:654-1457(-)